MISYLLYYLLLLPVSYLPFPVLYAVSDFLFVLIYYVFPYRKKVVLTNLKNSFPQKSDKEIQHIAKKYYSHLCDIILETVKSFTISKKQMRKRMHYNNPELAHEFFKEGKSMIVVTGHYNNWEWLAMSSPFYMKHKTLGLYMPLTNKFFDTKVKQSRCNFGIEMYSVRQTKEYFEKNHSEGLLTMTGFIGDQTPSNIERCHWMRFLNQDTPVYTGTEKYATLYNYPVIFAEIKKIKRGYYEMNLVLMSEKPQEEKPFAVTERHTHHLEKLIVEQPEFWLWTHKRWKHVRK